MPDKYKSANHRLRLLIGLGVFLLVVEMAVIGGWRLFSDGDYLTVMLNSFQHLIAKQTLKQVQSLPRTGFGGDDKQTQGQNTTSSQEQASHFDGRHFPVMVMIDNSPEARVNHHGLSTAAIVYETLVEGGATRLAALFAGAPEAERIGPVRSARPVFVEQAAGWGALYWHAGGSPEALAQIKQSSFIDFNEISYLGPRYFWRDRKIARPHNLFTDGELITAALTVSNPKFNQDVVSWQWGDASTAASSSPAAAITIDFSPGVIFDAAYNYDVIEGNYARSQGGRPHVDRGTQQQIAADNVIVQKVPVEGYYPSGYGRLIINTVGEGSALFFRGGRAFAGRWRKLARASQTEWLDDSGAPFILKPGTVWVEIVPGSREVIYK